VIVEEVVGKVHELEIGNRKLDPIHLEWFESSKRIQRKKTSQGRDIAIRLLKQGQSLRQGDVLAMDEKSIVFVEILPCEAIEIAPLDLYSMGVLCYEIGNKHLPIFIQDGRVLLPFEDPIFRWLVAKGFEPLKVHTKLLNLINSTVQGHGHRLDEGPSIFEKILSFGSRQT